MEKEHKLDEHFSFVGERGGRGRSGFYFIFLFILGGLMSLLKNNANKEVAWSFATLFTSPVLTF